MVLISVVLHFILFIISAIGIIDSSISIREVVPIFITTIMTIRARFIINSIITVFKI